MKLTVAVVAYGRYKYLDEAAASIARQTRPPDEMLVFTDNREAVRPIFQKHGVDAEILQASRVINGEHAGSGVRQPGLTSTQRQWRRHPQKHEASSQRDYRHVETSRQTAGKGRAPRPV